MDSSKTGSMTFLVLSVLFVWYISLTGREEIIRESYDGFTVKYQKRNEIQTQTDEEPLAPMAPLSFEEIPVQCKHGTCSHSQEEYPKIDFHYVNAINVNALSPLEDNETSFVRYHTEVEDEKKAPEENCENGICIRNKPQAVVKKTIDMGDPFNIEKKFKSKS